MVGQKYFKGEGKRTFGWQKYTKYNEINYNSENFRGAKLLLQGLCPLPPLVEGLLHLKNKF